MLPDRIGAIDAVKRTATGRNEVGVMAELLVHVAGVTPDIQEVAGRKGYLIEVLDEGAYGVPLCSSFGTYHCSVDGAKRLLVVVDFVEYLREGHLSLSDDYHIGLSLFQDFFRNYRGMGPARNDEYILLAFFFYLVYKGIGARGGLGCEGNTKYPRTELGYLPYESLSVFLVSVYGLYLEVIPLFSGIGGQIQYPERGVYLPRYPKGSQRWCVYE